MPELKPNESLEHDPDALLSAWADLVRKHEHLHQPQAAAMLRVPEASLVAARAGEAATRLTGDLVEILQCVSGFGKVLIAVPHHAGVLIGIAKPVQFSHDDGNLRLHDAHNALTVRADRVAHIYTLIEQEGMHGRERHLQAFDENGNGLFKLLILYKRNEPDLVALSQQFADPQQSRVLALAPNSSDLGQGQPASPGDTTLATMGERLQQHVAAGGTLVLDSRQPHVSLRTVAEAPKVYGLDQQMLHMRHAVMKLHAHGSKLGTIHTSEAGFVCSRAGSQLSIELAGKVG